MLNRCLKAGLLVATISVIVSTDSPDPRFFDWSRPVPYLCILWALPYTLGALIIGAMMVVAVTGAQAEYVRVRTI